MQHQLHAARKAWQSQQAVVRDGEVAEDVAVAHGSSSRAAGAQPAALARTAPPYVRTSVVLQEAHVNTWLASITFPAKVDIHIEVDGKMLPWRGPYQVAAPVRSTTSGDTYRVLDLPPMCNAASRKRVRNTITQEPFMRGFRCNEDGHLVLVLSRVDSSLLPLPAPSGSVAADAGSSGVSNKRRRIL